ncbi:ABC transporter ATP-binding protein [Roseococcus sp. DSY-14]|uniref:ABC transporter ATP-binding protein n=1 Tax=Roseococcus sp. DSY-14 TaxID=3369650 RepID=UPI00387AFEDF
MSAAILEAGAVKAGYGAGMVLHGIDFSVRPGEAVGLMGRNGMGKTTLLRTMLGLLPLRGGRVAMDGADISREAPFRRIRRGIAVVPEGRGVFASLTVPENLRLAARPGVDGSRRWTEERVLDTFPRLKERLSNRGDQLSGGEQQMLAIGRALMTNPRLLILDEATEGLAPLIRDEIWRVIATIRETGIATIVVDKTVASILSLVDRSVVIVKGAVVFDGPPAALQADEALMHRCLGV